MRNRSAVLVLLAAGCAPSATTPASTGGEAETAEAATANAAAAIDPARCEEGRGRLRPFIVSWDATEQAELAAHAQKALAVVKLSGCALELLPTCRIPGEYRFRRTTGNMQSLVVRSRDELYAKLPLSVVELSGKVERERALTLRYYVRGLRYATAPLLYRSQLAEGCEGATHFVLNYATGAYELDVARGSGEEAGAGVLGAGAGARHDQARHVVYQGGDVAACQREARCDAPIRLRLLPILDGEPPPEIAEAAARSVTRPTQAAGAADSRSREAIQGVVRSAFPGFRACYEDMLGRSPEGSGRLEAHFTVAPDGVVSQLDLVVTGELDKTFIGCFRDVLHGVRFAPAAGETTIVYPIVFTPG